MPGTPVLRWYRSLYGRVALGYALLLPVLLGAQAAAVVALANQRDQTSASERLERAQVARHVAQTVSQRLEASPGAGLGDLVEGLQPASRIFVVMRSGAVYERRGPGSATLDGFVRGMQGLREFDQLPGDWTTGDYGAAPVIAAGKIVGLVGITPRSMFERYGGTIVALGTGLLFIGNLALGLLVVKPIRLRLRSLYSAAARLRDGDMDARASVGGADELAQVGRVFNEMATELARRTRELETSDRLRRQLVADVSHELMTPLTSVLARLETLGMHDVALSEEQRTKQLTSAVNEAHRLERLIGDLLASARLEAGAAALALEQVVVEELFGQIASRHEAECRARGVRLTQDITAPRVVADRFRLDQALDNLVANALRHTSRGGRIRLASHAVDDRIHLSVWDSAGAIAPEHLPHIFDRFYKVESTNGIASPGSGLGLSIVQAIATRHGGHVRATSSNREGTTFTIQLPMSRDDVSAPATDRAAS